MDHGLGTTDLGLPLMKLMFRHWKAPVAGVGAIAVVLRRRQPVQMVDDLTCMLLAHPATTSAGKLVLVGGHGQEGEDKKMAWEKLGGMLGKGGNGSSGSCQILSP